jgi:hypothetical protein
MRENRLSGSEGGGAKPIDSPYPYIGRQSRWKNVALKGQEYVDTQESM